jgi:hypothetical protein
MVIECGPTAKAYSEGGHKEEDEGISLGIPVCEALDLEAIEERSGQKADIGGQAARSATIVPHQVMSEIVQPYTIAYGRKAKIRNFTDKYNVYR